MIDTGTPAPDFTLPDQDGHDVALADLVGRPVVLYFYPKADTPGLDAVAQAPNPLDDRARIACSVQGCCLALGPQR